MTIDHHRRKTYGRDTQVAIFFAILFFVFMPALAIGVLMFCVPTMTLPGHRVQAEQKNFAKIEKSAGIWSPLDLSCQTLLDHGGNVLFPSVP